MPQAPVAPKIYHILHVDKLPLVIQAGSLWSDSRVMKNAPGGTVIGMTAIKERRLTLPVSCHTGTFVGDYVPFYFCARSIMLYVISRANHPELDYRGGQLPIIHMECDLHGVVDWANKYSVRWAFSLSNAGAYYAQFRANLCNLNEVNWPAMGARDFRPEEIKEGKQAEFLVHDRFPWELVERIGVCSNEVAQQVLSAMKGAAYRPKVEIVPGWYY